MMEAIMDDSFDNEAWQRGEYDMEEKEKEMAGGLPCILILNKVDLITNKRKMRTL